MVGSCQYGNEHSGHINGREFLSSWAVAFKGILNQNRKELSSKMCGQYIQTTPALNVLHQTTGDWLIFLKSTSAFPQTLHTHPSIIREIDKGPVRGHISTNTYSYPTSRIKSLTMTVFLCIRIFTVGVADDDGCLTPMYPDGVSLKNHSGFGTYRIRKNKNTQRKDGRWCNKFELVSYGYVNNCSRLLLY